ncbi:MAG: ribosomal protein glutaminyl transferase [Candidatus Midichloriaceae bacterium]|jgi:ribosomal protein S6--L-glutamate ligase|nr:ribosomal protein glutaminyl transferase [Candidatus Midichloriaceae bacterium]
MKIAILSRNISLYSTRRLYEAAVKRGHKVRVIDSLKCYMSINQDKSSMHYKQGEVLENFDAIIPRIGASITFYATAILRQFESMRTYPLNPSIAITRARDKLRAHQLLARKGIGMPITGFAHSPSNTKDLIKMVGGAPLVIKLLEGTQGKGVLLADNEKMAETLIEAFRDLEAFFLVQEFIEEAKGMDIRCFVIGDKVVAAMARKAQTGDFRANIHLGATAEPIKITPKERKMAVQAAKIIGLNVAGVDIVRSKRGPLVLEVNSSPGLKGIEAASGLDIADMIIKYMENNAKPLNGNLNG